MPIEVRAALAAALAFVVTLALTPLAARLAHATGFLDRPGGYKGHAAPTPYLGGTALLAATLVAALALADGAGRFPWLLAGALALWAAGTLDDRVGVPAGIRLAAAMASGGLLSLAGDGWQTGLGGAPDVLLSAAWTGAVAIAFNLLDNIDGAAATAGAVSAAGIGALAAMHDDAPLAALGFALCAACLAFLRHNLAAPARIFLGDGGSLPLGFLVAGAVMALPIDSEPTGVAVLAALLLAGVPLVDSSYVLVARIRRGVPPTQGGRDHTTHLLLRRLGSARRVALVIAAVQAGLCAIVVAAVVLAG